MQVEVDKPWLMLGDCLEMMQEIPDGSVDMVLCDLPYEQPLVNGTQLFRLSRYGRSTSG